MDASRWMGQRGLGRGGAVLLPPCLDHLHIFEQMKLHPNGIANCYTLGWDGVAFCDPMTR